MTSVEDLIGEHEQLTALAERLESCVRHACDPSTAIALKTELSIALGAHLACEDRDLYDRLASSGNVALTAASLDYRGDLAILAVDWEVYLREWCDDAVETDWDTFADHTRSMMIRLRNRIRRENEQLFPLALQQSILQLRAAA